jgi:hypothetical protein
MGTLAMQDLFSNRYGDLSMSWQEGKDQQFSWTCPRRNCNKEVKSWTDYGLELLVKAHQLGHTTEDMYPDIVEANLTVSDRAFLRDLKVRW